MLVVFWVSGNGIRSVADKGKFDLSTLIVETSLTELTDTHWSLMLTADPDRQIIDNYLPACRVFTVVRKDEVIAVALLFGVVDSSSPQAQCCFNARAENFGLSAADAELINIAVADEHQGEGYGKNLIKHCIQSARESGYERLWVATGNSSLSQLALYQKMGFRMDHVIPSYFAEYSQEIFENGIQCIDLVRLQCAL